MTHVNSFHHISPSVVIISDPSSSQGQSIGFFTRPVVSFQVVMTPFLQRYMAYMVSLGINFEQAAFCWDLACGLVKSPLSQNAPRVPYGLNGMEWNGIEWN